MCLQGVLRGCSPQVQCPTSGSWHSCLHPGRSEMCAHLYRDCEGGVHTKMRRAQGCTALAPPGMTGGRPGSPAHDSQALPATATASKPTMAASSRLCPLTQVTTCRTARAPRYTMHNLVSTLCLMQPGWGACLQRQRGLCGCWARNCGSQRQQGLGLQHGSVQRQPLQSQAIPSVSWGWGSWVRLHVHPRYGWRSLQPPAPALPWSTCSTIGNSRVRRDGLPST